MAPHVDTAFTVCCENGFEGKLSPDAFGITVCLFAYSQPSFGAGAFSARPFTDFTDSLLLVQCIAKLKPIAAKPFKALG